MPARIEMLSTFSIPLIHFPIPGQIREVACRAAQRSSARGLSHGLAYSRQNSALFPLTLP